MQPVRQALPLQVYAPQLVVGVAGWQEPPPSHVRALTSEAPSQPGAAHCTPLLANARQPPAPSHMPSAPHEPGYPEPTAQAFFGSMSALIGPQTPSVPWPFLAAEQASQPPLHGLSQQTPSTQ